MLLGLLMNFVTGCTGDDCGRVACAPTAPPVIVSVLDSIYLTDTTIVGRVLDADVRIFIDNDAELLEFEALQLDPSDSTYRKSDQFVSEADAFALVATRDGVSDTITDIDLVRVEGCCPRTVLGVFTINLARKGR